MFCLHKLACLYLLPTTINEIRSEPIGRKRKLHFRSDRLVRMKGTDFKELNCVSQSLLTEELCSNTVEVACSTRASGIQSCEIIEGRGVIRKAELINLNLSIVATEVVCLSNRHKNCYLTFSFNVNNLESIQRDALFTKIDSYDDELRKSEETIRRSRIMMFIYLIVFILLIVLPGLFFCGLWIYLKCFTNELDNDASNQENIS